MSSRNKILMITILTTLSFLLRDTLRINGPIDMTPTFIVLFVSLVSSFFLIYIFENRKTQNHSKLRLALISFTVALLSIFSAYVLNIRSYLDADFLKVFVNNIFLFINNIKNFGFLILIVNILFGLIFGSNKNLGKAYLYKPNKYNLKK